MESGNKHSGEHPPKSFFGSVFSYSCPHCRKGKLFKKKWPSSMNELADMNDRCMVCERYIEMEPGFYYGSMYVSYALTVALFVTVWVAFSVLAGSVFDSPWTFLSIVTAVIILLMPITFRLSRSLWAHMFIKYKGLKTVETAQQP